MWSKYGLQKVFIAVNMMLRRYEKDNGLPGPYFIITA